MNMRKIIAVLSAALLLCAAYYLITNRRVDCGE